MATPGKQDTNSRNQSAIVHKRKLQKNWEKLKEEYGGLIWIGPGIVGVHELSHIIIGKGLNMRYGWYGFSMYGEIPEAIFGSIGVYVNEVTPWTYAAGLVGSLLWIAVMRRYGTIFGLHMTRQTFRVGLIHAVWIAKWDLKWLTGEILKVFDILC